MRASVSLFTLAAMLTLALAAPANAQSAANLRDAGVAGDQADGYMGVVPSGGISEAQRRAMDQINIQRRADFTQKAAETGVTVQQFGQFAACEIFKNSVKPGNWYRDSSGAWKKATGPVPPPPWCK